MMFPVFELRDLYQLVTYLSSRSPFRDGLNLRPSEVWEMTFEDAKRYLACLNEQTKETQKTWNRILTAVTKSARCPWLNKK